MMNLKTNIFIKNFFISFLGINLLTLGLNLIILSKFGVSPFDTFCLSVSKLFNLDMGDASFTSHLILFFICIILYKKVEMKLFEIFITLFWVIIATRLINFYSQLLTDVTTSNYILFVVGFIIFTFGMWIMLKMNFVVVPLDKFIIVLSRIFKKNVGIIKTILDIFFFIISMLLIYLYKIEVPINFGTFILTFFTGSIIVVYDKIYYNIIN